MVNDILQFFVPYIVPLLIIAVVVLVLPLLVGYVVLMERKIMADMQARLGPMRVGPHGLLQPIADAVKLLIKEDIIPEKADKLIFWLAPLISVTAGMLSFAALTFAPGDVELFGHKTSVAVADMNIGLLFILAVSSMGIFGIVLGGWASNNHYSLLGALRGSAQLVSYEVAAGMALVVGILLAGTLSTRKIIEAQFDGGVWFVFLAPVAFFIYLVASIAETNRAPFDLPEAESELVAGYMTEYSGFRWSVYFLAEYCNMIVVAGIATTLFLGGWMRPMPRTASFDFLDFVPPLIFAVLGAYCFYRAPKQPVKSQKIVMAAFGLLCFGLAGILALPLTPQSIAPQLANTKPVIHGIFWFLAKVFAYIYAFMWIRFTFPRYRFDQLMKLGWYFLIPVSIVNVFAMGTALLLIRSRGWSSWVAIPLAIVATLAVAAWLIRAADRRDAAVAAETEQAT